MANKLVAYFSATGTTARAAKELARKADADLVEIRPTRPYSTADLNWNDENSRSTREMKEHNTRPPIKPLVRNPDDYDVIYLGFPIWWYRAPKIIRTFLETHNMSGKTIVVWATSGGSSLGSTTTSLQRSAPGATLVEGGLANNTHSIEKIAKKGNV
jgi:flavodoxin